MDQESVPADPGGDRREIALSRKKIVGLMAISVMFVAMGLWLVSLDPDHIAAQRRWNNPLLVHGVGWACVGLAVFGGGFAVRKMFDKRPGLVLDRNGLVDNTTGAASGFVPWSDVAGFGVFESHKQRSLVIHLADPEKYLSRGGRLRRAFNRMNAGFAGSPVVISAVALRIDFDEMSALCQDYFRRYGPQGQTAFDSRTRTL